MHFLFEWDDINLIIKSDVKYQQNDFYSAGLQRPKGCILLQHQILNSDSEN